MRQPLPGEDAVSAENELDIRGLFRTLWSGKVWIVGMALAFAIAALAYTFLRVRSGAPRRLLTGQRSICWVAFTQQQFLRNLDIKASLASTDQPSVMDEAYKEFIMQLASGIHAENSGSRLITISSVWSVIVKPMRRCWMN